MIVAMSALACGANEGVLRAGKETPSAVNAGDQRTAFEKGLDAMRTAGFSFIYVVRRKDGKTLDSDDISVIKVNSADTNRRVKTDDDRAVMIGSNADIAPNNSAALYARFSVENYSEPPTDDANTNANSNK